VLVLVRHGQSIPAVEGTPFPLHDGHGDPPLSPAGEAQAEAVASRLADLPLAAIYVSTLRRTAQTAAPLAEATGVPVHVEPDLREVFLGAWEGGLYRQKVVDGDPVAVQVFTEERWELIPDAEPTEAFARRVRAAIDRIADAHPGQVVVAVSHGAVIGQLAAEVTGARPFAFVGNDNAAITVLQRDNGRWALRLFNDTSHLDDGRLGLVTDP
jgi:probable phosphoglycerate mutase